MFPVVEVHCCYYLRRILVSRHARDKSFLFYFVVIFDESACLFVLVLPFLSPSLTELFIFYSYSNLALKQKRFFSFFSRPGDSGCGAFAGSFTGAVLKKKRSHSFCFLVPDKRQFSTLFLFACKIKN